MDFIKKNYSYIIIGILAVAVLIISILSGKNGIYFYDTGFNYSYGWLICNGKLPFSNIITPIAPLCGYLIALGYKIFGVSYISNVYLGAIMSAIQFIFMSHILKKDMNSFFSILFAICFTFAGIPLIGIIYYNALVVYFLSLIICCMYVKLFYKNSNLYTALMWTFIVFAGFTKMHVGFLCAIFGIIFEYLLIRINNEKITKSHLYSIFVPLFIGGILFFSCIGWNFPALIDCITIPNMKLWTGLYPITIYSFSIVFLFVLLLSITLYSINKKTDNLKLFLFLLYFLLVIIFVYYTTPDKIFTFLMFVSLIFLSIYKLAKTNIAQFKIKYMYIAILTISLLWMSIYDLRFMYKGGRKQWDEYVHRFDSNLKMGKARTHEGFFKHIRVRDKQLDAIKIIGQIADENKDKKIFLASACEMFYPAQKIMPPNVWILSSHPGTTMSLKHSPMLEKILKDENYDLIIFVKDRLWMSPYMNFNNLGFKYISGSQNYWFFVASKNQENAVSIQNIYNKITNINENYEEIR